jgi:hypothetical protein
MVFEILSLIFILLSIGLVAAYVYVLLRDYHRIKMFQEYEEFENIKSAIIQLPGNMEVANPPPELLKYLSRVSIIDYMQNQ